VEYKLFFNVTQEVNFWN